MSRLMALVVKEFLSLLKDPRSRFVVIGPPIIQLIVFGYAATFDVTDVALVVYNESQDGAARELVSRFTGSPHFQLVGTVDHDEEMARYIDQGDALMALHIGPDFRRQLQQRGSADVQILVDGRQSNTALIVLGYAGAIVEGFNREWIAREGGVRAPARLQVRAWYNPNMQSRWFIVPGITGLLTLVVTMLVTALSVAREREQGTFDQLLVTPYRPWEILIGKALPGFVIGVVEASFIVAVAILWFRIPFVGSAVTLYLGIVLFVLAAIGVGLSISSLAVTQQQALLGAFLFLVPSIILSGFATPIANMARPVQYLTYVNPLRYFEVILRRVFLEGTPTRLLWPQFWPLIVIAAVTLTTATFMFRRRSAAT